MEANILVSTGSIYFLMIIAAKNLRVKVGLLQQTIIDNICNALRWPDHGKSWAMIRMFYHLTCVSSVF